jgi:hypothetical protein
MKYINIKGERTDVPEKYYAKYTEAEWKEIFPDGLDDNCSCGSDIHDTLRDKGMECKCGCHD